MALPLKYFGRRCEKTQNSLSSSRKFSNKKVFLNISKNSQKSGQFTLWKDLFLLVFQCHLQTDFQSNCLVSLHKKGSFPLRIFSVNVTIFLQISWHKDFLTKFDNSSLQYSWFLLLMFWWTQLSLPQVLFHQSGRNLGYLRQMMSCYNTIIY